MQENTITQLIYLSSATGHLAADDLKQIFESSVRNNGGDGITGLLIYHEGAFFQVLEGPAQVVAVCFDRIEADARHGRIIRMIERQVPARAFPAWRMGFARPEELGEEARAAALSLYDIYSESGSLSATVPDVRRLVSSFLNSFTGLSLKQ